MILAQNVTISLTRSMFMYQKTSTGTTIAGGAGGTTLITVTLQPGETGVFDTDWDVTASIYPIEFVFDITSLPLDSDTNNNSYSEIINTSP